MEDTRNSDQNFEAERELQIEQRHRNEILNLLKSFEFEKKDMEARFQKELESKKGGKENHERNAEMEEFEVQNLPQSDAKNESLGLEERLQKEKDEQRVEFEKEKENLLLRIAELEGRTQKQDENDGGYSAVTSSGKNIISEFTQFFIG